MGLSYVGVSYVGVIWLEPPINSYKSPLILLERKPHADDYYSELSFWNYYITESHNDRCITVSGAV